VIKPKIGVERLFNKALFAFRHSPSAISLLVFAQNHGQAQGPAPTKDIELRIAKTDYEKTAHHFSFSPFAIRLPQFLYWCLPKIMGRHVERSNVYYTGHGKQREFNGDRRGRI
jgi:hypothetical protein